MFASGLFHKKKAKKKKKSKAKARRARSARGTGNPCCPIIRVRCARKFAKGPRQVAVGPREAGAAPSIHERLSLYKRAKKQAAAAFKRAGFGGVGPIHSQHEMTSAPVEAVATVVAHARANRALKCVISVGGRTYKGMTGAQSQAKISELMRVQRAKRCLPKVERG